MKNIIVAADFTGGSKAALDFALKAAADKGLNLIIFYRYEVPSHVLNARVGAEAVSANLRAKEQELIHFCAKMQEKYATNIRAHFATGDFFEVLDHCIQQEQGDLLLLGMPLKSLEQNIFGNTTTAALRRLKTPIMIIPNHVQYNGIKRILFACDILRGKYLELLQQVKVVAGRFGAEVEVFHVSKVAYDLQEDKERAHSIRESMEDQAYYYKNVSSKDIVQAIKAEVEHYAADLLIMAPQRHGFWSSLLHTSKTKVMAVESPIPLLSLPMTK